MIPAKRIERSIKRALDKWSYDSRKTDIWRDRQEERERRGDRQKGERERERDRQTDRERQTERERDRQREVYIIGYCIVWNILF